METGFRQELSSLMPATSMRRGNAALGQPSASSISSNDTKTTEQSDPSPSAEEQRIVQKLAARDREVRAHEAAHLAVGGQYVISGASYTYQQGPDGRSYAVGGEVRLDVGEAANSEETLTKAEIIMRAALAPADPSPQDRRVAAQASQMAAQARLAIAMESRQAMQESQSGESEKSKRLREFGQLPQDEGTQQINVYA